MQKKTIKHNIHACRYSEAIMFQGQTLDIFMAIDIYVYKQLDSIFSRFTYCFIFAFEFLTSLYCVGGTVRGYFLEKAHR